MQRQAQISRYRKFTVFVGLIVAGIVAVIFWDKFLTFFGFMLGLGFIVIIWLAVIGLILETIEKAMGIVKHTGDRWTGGKPVGRKQAAEAVNRKR